MSDSTGQQAEGSRYNPGVPAVRPEWAVEIDLHLHTTASDGTLSPRQLIDQVAATSLRVVSITDHDSTNGLAEASEAAALHPHLTVIPGVELGTTTETSDLHMLGYFIDAENADFQAKIEQFRSERVEVARAMVRRLEELKRPVSWERITDMANGAMGRPHIARAMVEAGHVETIAEAFERYLGDDGIARVSRPKLHPVEALEMIHSAGGIGSIAHPRTVKNLDDLVKLLVAAGLVGIEVYAEKYASNRRDGYLDISTQYNLVPTGGTDYHALGAKNETAPGTNGPPPDTVSKLLARARDMHGSSLGSVPAGLE